MLSRIKNSLYRLYRSTAAPWVANRFHQDMTLHTANFEFTTYCGVPIRQTPFDLQTIQETICQVRPELLIETGTNMGGSGLFYCHLFDALQFGSLITVDVERLHYLHHPRATCLLGSSVSEPIVKQIAARVAACSGPVMVILDSDHSEAHVLAELRAYAPFVTPGSYLLCQDGIIDLHRMYRALRPGPLPAIETFLKESPEFTVDEAKCNRFLITHHPRGWLKRRA